MLRTEVGLQQHDDTFCQTRLNSKETTSGRVSVLSGSVSEDLTVNEAAGSRCDRSGAEATWGHVLFLGALTAEHRQLDVTYKSSSSLSTVFLCQLISGETENEPH